MKFYVARDAGTFDSLRDALRSVGFVEEAIDTIVQNADIAGSPSVFAYTGPGRGVTTTEDEHGRIALGSTGGSDV